MTLQASGEAELAQDILLATSDSLLLPAAPTCPKPRFNLESGRVADVSRSHTLAQRLSDPRARLQRLFSGREQEERHLEREELQHPSALPPTPPSHASTQHQHEEEPDRLPDSRLRLAPSVLDLQAPGGSSRSPTPVQLIRADGSAAPITPSPRSNTFLSASWSSEESERDLPVQAADDRTTGLAAARALLALVPPTQLGSERLVSQSASLASSSEQDIASHGTLIRDAAPPEWFAQSFPVLQADQPTMQQTDEVDERQVASSSRSAVAAPQSRASPPAMPSFKPLLRSASSAAPPHLSRATSSAVRLHGNARAARSARATSPAQSDHQDDSAWALRASADDSDDSSLASLAPTDTRSHSSSSRRRASSIASSRSGEDGEERHGRARSRKCFAREVKVAGWRTVGSKARGHVIYEVRIATHAGTTLTLFRRFSAFLALQSLLVKALPVSSIRMGHKDDVG